MHKLAIGFFYACAVLTIVVTASIFIDRASEHNAGHRYATADAR